MSGTVWSYVISMGGYFIILISITSIMRKHYRFANYFWIGAIFTFPLWLRNVDGWFRWAKTLSVLLPTILTGLSRVSNIEKRNGKIGRALQKKWVLWALYGVLFLNIAEATIKDYQMGNMLNALCGVILCVTIPFPDKFWNIGKNTENGGCGDLLVYTTIGWNFLYTTWNACFVYAEAGAFFASSLCIIFAAEIYPLIKRKPELYIMTRVYTLATHMLIRGCFGDIFKVIMDASAWHNNVILAQWGVLNAILCIPYVMWYIWQLHSKRADSKFIRKDYEELKIA